MNERQDEAGDHAFAEKASKLFDDSVEGLDAETCSALNRNRQAALNVLDARRVPRMTWLPAAGVAVAGVAALMLWTASPPPEQQVAPVATDMEILLNEDSLEMLEDLEFYSWMDLEAESGEAQAPENHVG
jgi:hypothetical protein